MAPTNKREKGILLLWTELGLDAAEPNLMLSL